MFVKKIKNSNWKKVSLYLGEGCICCLNPCQGIC